MKKATKGITLTGVLLIVLGGALVTACFATGLIPTLLVSPDKELAAREATATFAANNGLVSTAESGSKSTDDPIAEESALLILCEKHNIALTKDEEAYCDNYYETVMPIMEADENQTALNSFMEIVESSGLSLDEYETVSEANMKYAILREKLIDNIYSGNVTDYKDAIAECIQDNGL